MNKLEQVVQRTTTHTNTPKDRQFFGNFNTGCQTDNIGVQLGCPVCFRTTGNVYVNAYTCCECLMSMLIILFNVRICLGIKHHWSCWYNLNVSTYCFKDKTNWKYMYIQGDQSRWSSKFLIKMGWREGGGFKKNPMYHLFSHLFSLNCQFTK